jgi:hypothetical protein
MLEDQRLVQARHLGQVNLGGLRDQSGALLQVERLPEGKHVALPGSPVGGD